MVTSFAGVGNQVGVHERRRFWVDRNSNFLAGRRMPDIVTGALEFTKTDSIADIDGGKVWDRSAARDFDSIGRR